MWKAFSDSLFPSFCIGCGERSKDKVCPSCLGGLMRIRYLGEYFGKTLIVALDYKDDLVKKMIASLKFGGMRELAEIIGKISAERLSLEDAILDRKSVILVPIPIHKARRFVRGFDQSELLADHIGLLLGISVRKDILKRIRYSSPQSSIIDPVLRQRNISKSFSLRDNKEGFQGKTIILIDDVTTSGSTMREAEKTLRPLRPKRIIFFSSASSIK